MKQTFFITGTDTGVGKTVLTALLVKFLRVRGVNAAALKPVCSAGRGDAQKIFAALDGALALDEINPWHFRAPIAPLLAARRAGETQGSGAIESTCRQYQCRFKRPGQFWSLAGDEGLMCLETFWRNDRWHLLFSHIPHGDPAEIDVRPQPRRLKMSC
jgi:dethiobiotin synthetase